MIIGVKIRENASEIGFGQNQRSFNTIQLNHFLSYIFCISMSIIYIIQVADTPKEYLDAIYIAASTALVFIAYLCSIFQVAKAYIIWDLLQKIIDQNKFCAIKF